MTGAVLTVVTGAVYGASTLWYLTWLGNCGSGSFMLHLSQGTARGEWYPKTLSSNLTGFNVYTHLGAQYGSFRRWPSFNSTRTMSGNSYMLSVPLWILLIAVAAPTACFAFAARPRQLGLCLFCGYDLAGLASDAVCPECGKKA